MFPPQFSQFEGIVKCEWMPILYLLIYKETQLIGVAVTDVLPNSLSANYTFFDPEFDELALGKYAILQQILATKALGKHHLYLGYQIDSCDKMNYKPVQATSAPTRQSVVFISQRVSFITKARLYATEVNWQVSHTFVALYDHHPH